VLIEQHFIEPYLTCNKQLNDSEYAVSHFDQTITSKSLTQAAQKIAGFFVSRARYAEDILEKAVKNGVKQYVILGAGMDTFAF
jgi:O-methyltransferase involved in polyketide biosynthesis